QRIEPSGTTRRRERCICARFSKDRTAMSAESTESIIDLLYGELSEEEASEVRADLQSSPQLQAEHDELERMLGRVREVMPTEEVSPTIHASILDAARAGVASQERVPRRVAEPAKRHRFWARLAGGQG